MVADTITATHCATLVEAGLRPFQDLVARGLAQRAAHQALDALVRSMSDEELADLVDPGPAPPEPDDATLVELDDQRISAEMAARLPGEG